MLRNAADNLSDITVSQINFFHQQAIGLRMLFTSNDRSELELNFRKIIKSDFCLAL